MSEKKYRLAATLTFAASLAASGASAQSRHYVVHLDGSCMALKLQISSGGNVAGNSFGCGDPGRSYVGKIRAGNVAYVTSAALGQPTLTYKIGLRDKSWTLYETLDGEQALIGDGVWTKTAQQFADAK